MPELLPHHDGSPLYVSTDAPALGDTVRVRVRVPATFGPVSSIRTRSNPNREPQYTVASPVHAEHGWEWWEADITVENPVHGYRFLVQLADGRVGWLSAGGWSWTETLDTEDFKLVTHAPPPQWARSTVLYQIFPDRFARSGAADAREAPAWAEPAAWTDEVVHIGPSTPRQFYGGDLDGIREHLDHVTALGATMIYLTPIFPAHSNHRYDALSFHSVDPLLGGDAALVSLVEAAHAAGLGVIGDLTSNHSGDAHEWFTSSHLTPGAPESDFYYWHDAEQRSYEAWLGVPSLPKFNWNSAELRRRFIEGAGSVVAKWLEPPYSLDGWRIDVANMTGRYLEEDLNEVVRRTIRATMLEVNPDTILLGESTNDATADFQGDAWHGAMTYANFTRPVWSWLSEPGSPARGGLNMPLGVIPPFTAEQFAEAHRRFTAPVPWRVRLHTMNALDTHDTPRFRTHALPGAVPVALGLSLTLPGIPVIFAGDEFALTGDDGEHSRTPIPWTALEDEETDAAAAFALYRRLVAVRREHPALDGGGFRWLHVGDDLVAFVRESAAESVLVVAARNAFDVTLPVHAIAGEPVAIVGDASAAHAPDGIRLSGPGPSFTAWQLPGIELPAF
ncbi:glycoside hydrolase family 13 protein [Galbitalea sp. SE-J8]|uniref:glycoside hydrolase family 13 protein n=1 Tax=Galbitalea sp. SE-J8 TaxID=3054952 RepID=UPI00259C8027|nr:glycoside hydrolase family 13 protein [Galbitalea sp. SE-J8]MDM4762434.1 glycoside hydrolase family 13 protein [Galbitalea sp. SE-J8]